MSPARWALGILGMVLAGWGVISLLIVGAVTVLKVVVG